MESSDWTQGAKRVGVFVFLQLRVSQPQAPFMAMISCLWGSKGEHFIGEEREAGRSSGAAVGTQVEPGPQGQHQPFTHNTKEP